MPLSIKELEKKIQREDRILKKNQKTINKNNKEVQLIISNANINLDGTQLLPIIEWLEQMKDWEQESLHIRTINAYAQFHNGRISGMQLAIDLLNTIIKNNKNKKS
tara:strand:- start:7221 stop:7538 length:318 start_codon:yes stop_codon:yes gene_type:complete